MATESIKGLDLECKSQLDQKDYLEKREEFLQRRNEELENVLELDNLESHV